MRTRVVSSVGVVAVGLVPALVGGPVFAALMVALGLLGYREFERLATRLGAASIPPVAGVGVVVAFAAAGLWGGHVVALVAIVAAALAVPLVQVLGRSPESGVVVGWALATVGSLYVGLPIFAAVDLRQAAGPIAAPWLTRLADAASPGWASQPRGLAWVLLVVTATWIGDSVAYLVGRTWGRRPLAPRLSPKKTVAGAVGGLVGAAVAGALCVWLLGLDFAPVLGAPLGVALGAVGQVGDLGESLLKRQAGVKDSGALIPGHGGILDRIDALLFALPVGWLIANLLDPALR